MKNNRITIYQFSFCCFLSSLTFLLFIDYNPSLMNFSAIIMSLLIDTLIVFLYKGKANKIFNAVIALYLTAFCVIICYEFCRYMYYDLGYGPLWGIALVILGFTYFCTVKGIEPLYRAAVIISVFVFFSILFVAISSIQNIKFDFKISEINNLVIPFLLLFPSVIYILNFDNIIKEKKFAFNIYSVVLLLSLIYFHLLPKDKIAVGIFKGADGVLLAVLTVAVIYYISNSSVALFKGFKHRYISNLLYLSVIFALSITALYIL